MLKFVISYISALTVAWLGLHSLLVGLAYWGRPGAFMPLASGLGLLLIAARLIAGVLRKYYLPASRGKHRGGGLTD
jgi:hypothetical protein